MKFEHKKQPLAKPAVFRRRVFRYFLASAVLIAFSLGVGMFGYCYLGGLSLIDGFYNAAMILTGMGPGPGAETDSCKLFAAFYALYSGIAFLAAVSIVIAPALHRLLHKLHLAENAH
ncbi:MAG: hypothetical protein IPN76_29200 [Saprospiraceae bacterium]|nr:hypothetical protein [Saprospiraceae bacterium]